jgi:hypothetical protein
MSKWMLIGGAGAAVAAAIAIAQSGYIPMLPPTASYSGRQAAIPFEFFRDQRIFVTGTINGHETPMMLDSGAAMSVIDKAYATKLGLPSGFKLQVRGASGSVPTEIVAGNNLSVGGLHLDKLSVFVMDLSDVSRAIGHPTPVILGRDAFTAGLVTVDFPRRTISFADRSTLSVAGATRLALTDRGHGKAVSISVAGLPPVDADIDLGNGGTVLMSKDYWMHQPALAALPHARSQVGGVGGMKPAREATVTGIDIGGYRFDRVPVTMNEDPQSLPPSGANIGTGMFNQFVVTIDFPGNALYLKGPGEVRDLPRERAGVRTEFDGDHLNVVYVSPDGPGAAAGLKVGDKVVQIDGQKVGSDYFARPDWARGPAGKTITLTLADGSSVKVTLADYY